MIQPQLVNMTPNLHGRAEAALAKSHGNRESFSESFENMLGQGGVKGPWKTEAFRAQGKTGPRPAPEQPEQPQAEADASLYLLPPPLNPEPAPEPPPTADSSPAQQATQIINEIVSILEGKSNNLPVDKDIVSLLAKLEPLLAQLQTEAGEMPPEFAELLEEIMARTPQTEEITEDPQKLQKLSQFIETLRGYLCPPENANDQQATPEQVAEPLAVNMPAATHSESSGLSAQTEDGAPQTETKSEAASDTIPEDATFQLATPKSLFAERISAAAQPQAAQPLTAENLFETMVERIVSLPDAEPHMEISLRPQHLGKLSVDLQLTENGLTAKIISSDEGVRNMLASHLNRLSETLAERGIRVENVEVVYSPLSDQRFDQHPPEQQQNQAQNQGNYRAEAAALNGTGTVAEPSITLPWENAYDLPYYAEGLDLGLSSVEYRA